MMLQSLLKELLQTVLWGDGTRHGMTSMDYLWICRLRKDLCFQFPYDR